MPTHRSMTGIARGVSSVATALALAACASHANPYGPVAGPQASAGLDVTLPFAQHDAYVTALRAAVTGAVSNGVNGAVEIGNWGGYAGPPAQTVSAGTDLYVSALDDARRKATAVATRLGATLGLVQSVTEQMVSYPQPGMQSLKGGAPQSIVRVSPNEPIVLLVVYRVAGDAGATRSISVYGLSSTQTAMASASPQTPKNADVHLQLTGHGNTIDSATDALNRLESVVKDTNVRFHLPPSAMRVQEANISNP